MEVRPHSRSGDAVLAVLDATAEGLTSEEAQRRLAEYGENEVAQASERTPLANDISRWTSSHDGALAELSMHVRRACGP